MKCRSVEILAAAVVLFVSASPVMAVIDFNDGGTYDITTTINDDVWVDYESPGLETTLNILDGAWIRSYVRAWENSIVNMSGGSVYWLYAFGSSQVTVPGGYIHELLYARDNSQVTVSGGSMYRLVADDSSQVAVSSTSMRQGLHAAGSSQVTVSGGSMYYLDAHDSSQVEVSGGRILHYLRTYDSSQVAVSGGSMGWFHAYNSSQVAVSGGSMYDLIALDSSQVTVSGGSIGGELIADLEGILTMHGWNFAVDGMPVGYTELYSIFGGSYLDEPDRLLTGTLLSGDPINNQFRIGNNAKMALVPEPATLLLLGLGVVIARKR